MGRFILCGDGLFSLLRLISELVGTLDFIKIYGIMADYVNRSVRSKILHLIEFGELKSSIALVVIFG